MYKEETTLAQDRLSVCFESLTQARTTSLAANHVSPCGIK